MKKIISLHKYWVTADAINQVVWNEIGGNNTLPKEIVKIAEQSSSFSRLRVLYGLIYVVIEGYQELALTNTKIDNLLKNTFYIDALRKFRNATFHYQKEPITEKELEFLELKDSEFWIQDIHNAFRTYFEDTLPINLLIKKIGDT